MFFYTTNSLKVHETKTGVSAGKVDKCTIRVGDFNNIQEKIHRKSGRIIVDLNDTINQLNIVGIYRTLHILIKYPGIFTEKDHLFSGSQNKIQYT